MNKIYRLAFAYFISNMLIDDLIRSWHKCSFFTNGRGANLNPARRKDVVGSDLSIFRAGESLESRTAIFQSSFQAYFTRYLNVEQASTTFTISIFLLVIFQRFLSPFSFCPSPHFFLFIIIPANYPVGGKTYLCIPTLLFGFFPPEQRCMNLAHGYFYFHPYPQLYSVTYTHRDGKIFLGLELLALHRVRIFLFGGLA